MAKLISKFSDGTTDTYNGSRNVTAGYLVTIPEYTDLEGNKRGGWTKSGHSMTLEAAAKTGMSAAMEMCCFDSPSRMHSSILISMAKRLKMTVPQLKSALTKGRKAYRSAVKLEVVSL
jgi:hypothetical protein